MQVAKEERGVLVTKTQGAKLSEAFKKNEQPRRTPADVYA